MHSSGKIWQLQIVDIMRILVISNIELSDTNAGGNTFANWLAGWPNTEISSLYCRNAIPHNDFCDSYYCISPTGIIKNILTPWRIGHFFYKSDISQSDSSNIESKLIKKTKARHLAFLYLFQDFIISSRIWQNRRYRNYIRDFNPDIVFAFAKSEAFLYQNLKYIKKHSKAKIVYFYADDMYSIYQQKGLLRKIFFRRYPKVIKLADKNYGASVLLCETYSKQFGINLIPLYKGCSISMAKKTVNRPIKIIYAGNLFYGRENTLAIVAKVLKKINQNIHLAELEIYTTTVITKELESLLNIEGASKIMGARPFNEIVRIMKDADIVLHVESFNPVNMKIVRLSYSTKISDCLQSGSMMMVVGPDGIASVEEAKLIDGVMVINDEDLVEDRLRKILEKPTSIIDAASRINSAAKNKFPIESVRKRLYDDFVELIEKSIC